MYLLEQQTGKNKISRQAKCGNHNEFVELKFENKIENQNRNG